VTVIIPARNEEQNLPTLLKSLKDSVDRPVEVLVVDDHSTDNTSTLATTYGARVIPSEPLPHGWTGKTWACHQGALAAKGDVLLFLDADTSFLPGGYERVMRQAFRIPAGAALSILPFHVTHCWYEELSLFFNVLLAMGAGGFGGVDVPQLFGQSLAIHKTLYIAAGGHASVQNQILENLHFASHIRLAGGSTLTFAGRGSLQMRMFPHGLNQLRDSWKKAFASGACAVSRPVFWLSVYWLSAIAVVSLLPILPSIRWQAAASLYLLATLQIGWYGRQLGTFRWITAIIYPAPLVFYFAIFAQSAWNRKRRHQVLWHGRRV
jgi:4,4'-diaponeurosporenoate glycosyltransferase